jgi:2-amino-4-hydroxy-6-hydroxymethyldihydropteridine diphosphokinase
MAGPLAASPAAIALGSNLGQRHDHITWAVGRLRALLADVRVSAVRETEAVGVGAQPPYLNAAVVGLTTLEPGALLDHLLAMEQARGRERPWPGAPRTLDLDLVLLGSATVTSARLVLPHPRFRERAFVLEPLAEIAPELVDPVTGLTVGALWAGLARRLPRQDKAES